MVSSVINPSIQYSDAHEIEPSDLGFESPLYMLTLHTSMQVRNIFDFRLHGNEVIDSCCHRAISLYARSLLAVRAAICHRSSRARCSE